MESLNRQRNRRPRAAFLIAGIALIGGVWFFREPLRQKIVERAILANNAPSPGNVADMIRESADPQAALLAAWNSGKIVHRQEAIRSLAWLVPNGQPLAPELNSMLRAAALDPDLSVRESAFGVLVQRDHPALAALALEQLKDVDPQVRWLGLNQIKRIDPSVGMRMVVPLLDDSEPFIVAMALKLMERWSGESFGVKLSETAAFTNQETGLKEYPDGSREKAEVGAEKARRWWAEHQHDFPPLPPQVPHAAYASLQPVPSGDFQLPALDGDTVRLSDYRGKTVLLNFWTTWCTACVSEMPALIALQNKYSDELVILGVSLDYVPDSHGHIGGHAAVEDQAHSDGHHDDHESADEASKRIRQKVARTVKRRGINYPILLDEHNEAGGRFNGGELPTTVIVDAEGNVRRRFIGERRLPVFEAMISEATEPLKLANPD